MICLLLGLAAQQVRGWMGERAGGIDFYHYWGVGAVQKLSGFRLGSPYRAIGRYAAALDLLAERGTDPRLKAEHRHWGGFAPTGTPLLYASLLILPVRHADAILVYRALQLVFLAAAFALLGRLHRAGARFGAVLSLALLLGYGPIRSDLQVANNNSFLFLGFSSVVVLASSLPRVSGAAGKRLGHAVLLVTASCLVLLKPLWLPVAGSLLLMCCLTLRPRELASIGMMTLAGVALAVAAPCLAFRSWDVWVDWWTYDFGRVVTRLARPVADGNCSTTLLISQSARLPLGLAVALVGGLLAASLIVVLAGGGRGTGDRRRAGPLLHELRRGLGEPPLAMAIGVVGALALSPLVWYHYYVMLLIPALGLLLPPGPRGAAAVLAGVGLLLASAMHLRVLHVLGLGLGDSMLAWSTASSWAFVWLGVLADLRASIRRRA